MARNYAKRWTAEHRVRLTKRRPQCQGILILHTEYNSLVLFSDIVQLKFMRNFLTMSLFKMKPRFIEKSCIDRKPIQIFKNEIFFNALFCCAMLRGTKKWHDKSLHKKSKRIKQHFAWSWTRKQRKEVREREREREREKEKKISVDNYTLRADDIKCLIFDWYSSHRHFFSGLARPGDYHDGYVRVRKEDYWKFRSKHS